MVKRTAPVLPADESGTETAAKVSRAKKAPAAKAVNGTKKGRVQGGDRGWLAASVEDVCRKHAAGKLKGYEPGQPLTVSVLQGLITNKNDLMPSTGAVSAVLVRWTEEGYIKASGKPMAFVGFTTKYKDASLAKFLEDRKAKAAKEKAAKKAA